MFRYLVVGAALGLAACGAQSGTKVEQSQVQQFEVGKTTYDEVVVTLGPPTSSSISSDGTRTAVYSYAEYRTRPETFIPFAGAFIGGADTETSSATFMFDRDNVLTSYSASEGGSGISHGVQ